MQFKHSSNTSEHIYHETYRSAFHDNIDGASPSILHKEYKTRYSFTGKRIP